MKHKQKLKKARKMMTIIDIKTHTPPFQTEAWTIRKQTIIKRVKKLEAIAIERARKRKEAKAKI